MISPATGSTLFIEPMSVVKLNNDLKEAFLKEAGSHRSRSGRTQ